MRIVGIEPDDLRAPERRIPASALEALWVHVAQSLDDPGIPVLFADKVRLEDLHVMGFAVMTSTDVRESLERVSRFMVLLADQDRFDFEEGAAPGIASVRFHRTKDLSLSARLIAEHAVGCYLACFRQVCGVEFPPTKVLFRHRAPRDVSAHERFFRCPIEFGATRDGFLFPASLLEATPRGGNSALSAFFARHAEKLREQTASPTLPMAERTGDVIAHLLASGEPTTEIVARRLGVSDRSLRRRLESEGTCFREVVEGVRRRMAEQLLSESDTSMSEIAYLLGFSDVTTFTRAFKRSSGMPPGKFRDDARGPSAAAPPIASSKGGRSALPRS